MAAEMSPFRKFFTLEFQAKVDVFFDKFIVEAVPFWFSLLEWAIVIATLQFAAEKAGSKLMSILAIVSLTAVALYLYGYFNRLDVPGRKHENRKVRFWPATISGAVWFGLYSLVEYIVPLLKQIL
jgi:uncharacterized membrane protein YedE/YeeE